MIPRERWVTTGLFTAVLAVMLYTTNLSDLATGIIALGAIVLYMVGYYQGKREWGSR